MSPFFPHRRANLAPNQSEPIEADLLAAQAAQLLKNSAMHLTHVVQISGAVASKSAVVSEVMASFRASHSVATVMLADNERNAMLADAIGKLRIFAREAAQASLEIRSVIDAAHGASSSVTKGRRRTTPSMKEIHETLRLICGHTRKSAHSLQSPAGKSAALESEIDALLFEIEKNEIVAASAARAVEKYLNETIRLMQILNQIDRRS